MTDHYTLPDPPRCLTCKAFAPAAAGQAGERVVNELLRDRKQVAGTCRITAPPWQSVQSTDWCIQHSEVAPSPSICDHGYLGVACHYCRDLAIARNENYAARSHQ